VTSNLLATRCNPYGFGSDRGPKHLQGGVFGPEFAGPDLVLSDGTHGIGICERAADGWFVMVCTAGLHTGPRMPLCYEHVRMIGKRMAATCTACVMPRESRQLWEDQRAAEQDLHRAYLAGDSREIRRIQGKIGDLGKAQVELTMRGLTPRVPMRLVEVS
jgi:hypothetical protein